MQVVLQRPEDDPQCKQAREAIARVQASDNAAQRRMAEIETIRSVPAAQRQESNQAWANVLSGYEAFATEPDRELREEYEDLEQKRSFNKCALVEGKRALDAIVAALSTKKCEQKKPAIVKDLLEGIDLLAKFFVVHQRITNHRAELEDAGFRTGSIPCNIAPTLIEHARRYIAELRRDFPELAK
jgi:hypothetical protein